MALFSSMLVLSTFALMFVAQGSQHTEEEVSKSKPNIIFFLIDDWGYNDVGYYGNTDTDTSFINRLVREESLRLDKYYVMPECTATRCSFLTGRYPLRYGLQDGILYYQSPYALSNREYLLSNEFQSQGYKTHLVGKWHLGMLADEYTPLHRGFDSFLGFYAGLIYYYSHFGIEDSYPGKIDFHKDGEGWHEADRYTMFTYRDRIIEILDSAAEDDSNDPFFLYVGWQGSHYPSEAPDDYVSQYDTDDKDEHRQYFQAQSTLTDDLLQEMVIHLKEHNLWDNTLLVVSSDNGADWGYGDNSPLRGSKFTLWEGGIRVPAFVTGGYLPSKQKGKILDSMAMHVTDWYPTLLSAAGLDSKTPNELDGINLWKYFEKTNFAIEATIPNEISSDRVIILNADKYGCATDVCGGVLYGGRWKLVTGTNQLVSWEGGSTDIETCFWHRQFSVSEQNDMLNCGTIPDTVVTDSCLCAKEVCLFDLESDPCEYVNVYDEYSEIGDKLKGILKEYYDEQTEVLFDELFNVATVIAAKGDTGGYWEPWADSTEGWDGWENLKFEQLLLPYYTTQGKKIHSEIDKSLNALWIGLIVAGLGFSIFFIFLIWRFCCRKSNQATNNNSSNNNNTTVITTTITPVTGMTNENGQTLSGGVGTGYGAMGDADLTNDNGGIDSARINRKTRGVNSVDMNVNRIVQFSSNEENMNNDNDNDNDNYYNNKNNNNGYQVEEEEEENERMPLKQNQVGNNANSYHTNTSSLLGN